MDYAYDKLGRIESAVNKQSGHSEKFAFDPAHNILSDKVSDGLKDKGLSEHLSDRHHTGRLKGRNIGKGNRLQEYNGTEYTYDALGNMIYRQLPNGESQLFQYDSENQLIRAEIKKPKGNTEIWEYAYDPFGRRLSKERKDKLAWTSTAPKRTHFVWDGTRLLQEYNYKGSYTYVYTDQDSYEPLAQVFDNHKDRQQYLFYFHNNQIGTPHEMTDIHGNLLWYGSYSAWGSLASEKRIYQNVHQPFRLQNQYCDEETGLHYNFFRYYEPDSGRFINQDPIRLIGGDNLYWFAPNVQSWIDLWGLKACPEQYKRYKHFRNLGYSVRESTQLSRSTTYFHYTSADGLSGILSSRQLNPSLKANNPRDARYGDGQYLSDILPSTRANSSLSRSFVGMPFQGRRFESFVAIDTRGLDVIKGRDNVFVIPNSQPLDISGRIIGYGRN